MYYECKITRVTTVLVEAESDKRAIETAVTDNFYRLDETVNVEVVDSWEVD